MYTLIDILAHFGKSRILVLEIDTCNGRGV